MSENLITNDYLETFGAIDSDPDIRDYRIAAATIQEAKETFPKEFELDMPAVKNQGSVGSCHDENTEVLTRSGWKFFKDIDDEDLLASVDPNNGNLIFEKPINIIKERYNGEMICGQHRSLDFMVTPNHKMVVRKWIESERKLSLDYHFINAGDLGWWVGLRTDFHQNKPLMNTIILEEEKISNGNTLPRMEIDMYDWVALLGIYLAEGTLYKNGPESHYRIQLAAVKTREKDFIRDLLGRIGIKGINEQKDRFHFHNKRIWKMFESYGLVGVKSYEKFVPDFIFDLDESYIKRFLFAYAMGDGHFCKSGGVHYFTSSKTMSEQIQILLLMSGTYNNIIKNKNKLQIPRIKGREITAQHPSYTITGWTTNNLSITKKIHIQKKSYDGYVYCAEVPTYHTLITRRNGHIILSGNCVAHSLSTVIEYYNIKQHNEDTEMSVGYIYGNRATIGYQGEGMITRTAIADVCAEGDVPNTLFPFNEEVPGIIEKVRAEKSNLEESAVPFKFTSYFSVKTADEIKTALMKGCPVVFSITWHKGMKVKDGILTSGTNEKTGGHCMVIYGWDERGWKFQNSWGILWGNGGRAILPYDFKIKEAYCVIDEYVGDIEIKKPFKATTEFGKWLVRSLNKIYCFFYRIWYNSKH